MVSELLRSAPFSAMSLDEQRATVEAAAGPVADGTTVVAVDAGGVPCEWIATPRSRHETVIVALRGGGYCLGSLTSNRRFCALLADCGQSRVLNVGYRSAPEHRFPAALDDAVATYRWLLANGVDADSVILAGNSAGGGLALACLLALRDAGDPQPAGAVALSAWTDLAATGASIATNAPTEVMLDPDGARETALLYADPERHTDPYVSPLYGGLSGLPPLLLHVSGAEILLDDSTRFADRARRAGVDVTLDIVADMPHVWHLFAGFLPEADAAWSRIGAWIAAHRAA